MHTLDEIPDQRESRQQDTDSTPIIEEHNTEQKRERARESERKRERAREQQESHRAKGPKKLAETRTTLRHFTICFRDALDRFCRLAA